MNLIFISNKNEGLKIKGNRSESVAFKELLDIWVNEELSKEQNRHKLMGHHGN